MRVFRLSVIAFASILFIVVPVSAQQAQSVPGIGEITPAGLLVAATALAGVVASLVGAVILRIMDDRFRARDEKRAEADLESKGNAHLIQALLVLAQGVSDSNDTLTNAIKRTDETQERADEERERYDTEGRQRWKELVGQMTENANIQRGIIDQLAHPEPRFENVVADLKSHADGNTTAINAHTDSAAAASEKAVSDHFEAMDGKLDAVVDSLEELRMTAITADVFTKQMNPMVETLDNVLKMLHDMRGDSSPSLELPMPP